MKKLLIGAGVLAAGLAFGLAMAASAQTITPGTSAGTMSQQETVNIGANGAALVRGTIASISNGVITVTSWGGVWTVDVASGTQIIPAAAGNDITKFQTGDFIGVQGNINQTANWTINATVVRDWTYRAAINQEQKQNVQAARATIQNGTPKNYVGTASNVSSGSFTLTLASDGSADTVVPAPYAEIVNRNWVTMPLSAIGNWDNVRTWGTLASGTITAQIIRDVSIPATH